MRTVETPRLGPSPQLAAGTSLCARTVMSSAGDVLGSISDLMLDLECGRVAYAVIASGGFVGIGERLVAVPWSALKQVGQHFVLLGKPGALESAPAFDRDHWPVAPAPWWHERVHEHYRSRPYWE